MNIVPTGAILGATIEGLDLRNPLCKEELRTFLEALGRYGVLRLPHQDLRPRDISQFSRQFGSLQIPPRKNVLAEGFPEVMTLSNIVENGRAIGIADAGQMWHTDLTYQQERGFINVLYGVKIPHRDGKPLGATLFANMQKAYEDLPDDVKQRLEGATALHHDKKYHAALVANGSSRTKPWTLSPVSQPLVFKHPVTGKKVLYANPGFTVLIEGWTAEDSEEMLDYLFKHQVQEQYIYIHHWAENDVLVWDNLGTVHRAVSDYGPSESRLIYRCRVLAEKIFAREFAEVA